MLDTEVARCGFRKIWTPRTFAKLVLQSLSNVALRYTHSVKDPYGNIIAPILGTSLSSRPRYTSTNVQQPHSMRWLKTRRLLLVHGNRARPVELSSHHRSISDACSANRDIRGIIAHGRQSIATMYRSITYSLSVTGGLHIVIYRNLFVSGPRAAQAQDLDVNIRMITTWHGTGLTCRRNYG
jgi:hypothetical protein